MREHLYDLVLVILVHGYAVHNLGGITLMRYTLQGEVGYCDLFPMEVCLTIIRQLCLDGEGILPLFSSRVPSAHLAVMLAPVYYVGHVSYFHGRSLMW